MPEQDQDWVTSGVKAHNAKLRKTRIICMAQDVMVIQLASDLSNPKAEQAQYRHAIKALKTAAEAYDLIEQQADLFFGEDEKGFN